MAQLSTTSPISPLANSTYVTSMMPVILPASSASDSSNNIFGNVQSNKDAILNIVLICIFASYLCLFLYLSSRVQSYFKDIYSGNIGRDNSSFISSYSNYIVNDKIHHYEYNSAHGWLSLFRFTAPNKKAMLERTSDTNSNQLVRDPNLSPVLRLLRGTPPREKDKESFSIPADNSFGVDLEKQQSDKDQKDMSAYSPRMSSKDVLFKGRSFEMITAAKSSLRKVDENKNSLYDYDS